MLRTARVLLSMLAFLAWCGVAAPAQAASGDLDPSFGSGGMVTTDFPSPVDEANGVAIQTDGKIVVAGLKGGSEWDFSLARYNADGTLDPSFGSGGKVFTNLGDYVDQAFGVALQPDGKILAAGWSANDFALARYNTDGSLDLSFGSGGKVTTDFGGYPDYALAVTVQPDGKIVAVGGSSDFDLARYNPDGTLDTGFGSGGKVSTDFGSSTDQGVDVGIDSHGRIVAVGFSDQGATGKDFAVARYATDGTLDTGFDSDGRATTDFGSADQASAVAIQPDDRVVAAGSSDQGATGIDFALARYGTDGTLDTGFGSGGRVTTDFGSMVDQVGSAGSGLVIEPGGEIVAAGYSNQSATNYDFALAAYKPDGSLDTGFGSGGKVTTDFGYGFDVPLSLAVQPDGKLVAAGYTYHDGTADYALARYLFSGLAYTFGGFRSPVDNPPIVNTGDAGRTYPVKFQVLDGSGALVTDLAAVSSIKHKAVTCGSFLGDPTDALETTATGDTGLRFDTDQFVYNWKTPSATGCYELFVKLADGGVYSANFSLR